MRGWIPCDNARSILRISRPWSNLEAVEFATLDWVDWFNHQRLLGPIGHIPPVEAEQQFYATLNDSAQAA